MHASIICFTCPGAELQHLSRLRWCGRRQLRRRPIYIFPSTSTSYEFHNTHDNADDHNGNAKRNRRVRGQNLPPRATRSSSILTRTAMVVEELDIAGRRDDIRHSTCAGRAHQFEHDPQVLGDQTHGDRGAHRRRGDPEMPLPRRRLCAVVLRPEVVQRDFAADEAFERERGQHVQPEAETRDVYHGVVRGEVVEQVSLCQGAEGEEAGERHQQAEEEADRGREVSYQREAGEGRGAEGGVD